MKGWGQPSSGERVGGGGYPFFQPGEIFHDRVNFFPILFEFLLSKIIFERLGGYHFFC
jgi:hypothetical protein